ncbi:hypothetical protein GCM10010400_47040 [Streptomyces aculeolatus]
MLAGLSRLVQWPGSRSATVGAKADRSAWCGGMGTCVGGQGRRGEAAEGAAGGGIARRHVTVRQPLVLWGGGGGCVLVGVDQVLEVLDGVGAACGQEVEDRGTVLQDAERVDLHASRCDAVEIVGPAAGPGW